MNPLARIRTLVALGSIATLCACATMPADVARDYKPGTGCFIAAWGNVAEAEDRGSTAYFRKVGESYFGLFSHSPKLLSFLAAGTPFSDSDGRGVVFVRYVPPGNYVLANPEIHSRLGPAVYTQKPKAQTEIGFKVNSGECIYLGRFLLQPSADTFLWLDRRTSDLAVARQTLLPTLSISESVQQPRPIGGIFVVN